MLVISYIQIDCCIIWGVKLLVIELYDLFKYNGLNLNCIIKVYDVFVREGNGLVYY